MSLYSSSVENQDEISFFTRTGNIFFILLAILTLLSSLLDPIFIFPGFGIGLFYGLVWMMAKGRPGMIQKWRLGQKKPKPQGKENTLKSSSKFKDEDYFQLFNLSFDLACVANFEGYFLDVNPTFVEALGYEKKELLSRPFIDFVHPDDVEATLAEASRLTESKDPTVKFINRYRTVHGSYRTFQWNATQDMERGKLYCVVRDITEQRKIEEALEISQRYLLQAQKTAKIGHWAVDLEKMQPIWSEETFRIHDLEPGAEPDLEAAIDFFDEESKPIITEAFQACITKGQSYDVELKMTTAKGRKRVVRSIGQPEYQDGRIVNVIGVFQDITEQHRFKTKLALAKQKAEEASQIKSDFLSNMSHEIRTPLNAVIGAVNLLLQENPRENQLEMLKVMQFSSENLLSLVNDILDYNKIEAGKVSLENIEINLQNLTQSLLYAHGIKAKEKAINFDVAVGREVPEYLWADATRLTQILNNLITNAIKFTHEGEVRLEISAEDITEKPDKKRLTFKVVDTGIGISEDKLENIFESFTQASKDTTRKFGGTGLGLAISKNLVGLMGGELWVRSKVNEGSTFGFSLELSSLSGKSKEPEEKGSLAEIDIKGSKVLLVEDNPVNVKIAARFLEKWGLSVTHAENGQIAVEKARSQSFDLILMDLHMPVMGGKEASLQIRNFNKDIPIIALTASAPVQGKDELQACGMNGYVPKPFKPNEFYRKIKECLAEAHKSLSPN